MIRERLSTEPNTSTLWIILDEIQKIPALLDEVHSLIESEKWRFILTGSSARKLRRGGANLLGGRAIHRNFYPLTIWELGDKFDLGTALKFGLLPDIWNEPYTSDVDRAAYLSTYTLTYLKEEVMAEGLARNVGAFSRFLESVSFSQGQIITQRNIARDVGVDEKLIASYLEILEDLLLGVRLQVFSHRAKRRVKSHPKFFLFDSGVARSLRPRGPLDLESEIEGAGLETLFFHHHRALGEFVSWDQQLYFWKTANNAEVDFVSYGSLGLFAFEVKRSTIVTSDDMAALKLFKRDYPIAKLFLLYGGNEEHQIDGISILPLEAALRKLPEIFGVSLGAK